MNRGPQAHVTTVLDLIKSRPLGGRLPPPRASGPSCLLCTQILLKGLFRAWPVPCARSRGGMCLVLGLVKPPQKIQRIDPPWYMKTPPLPNHTWQHNMNSICKTCQHPNHTLLLACKFEVSTWPLLPDHDATKICKTFVKLSSRWGGC